MKKVGRLRLSELEGRMDTLTKAEQHEYLGGNNTWRIYGESKTVARGAAEGGTLFCGDNGKFVWFPGISVSSDWVTIRHIGMSKMLLEEGNMYYMIKDIITKLFGINKFLNFLPLFLKFVII